MTSSPLIHEATILSLNHLAEGMALHEETQEDITIPGTLPGERVSYTIFQTRKGLQAELNHILKTSPHRIPSPCPHDKYCGGCRLQHFTHQSYQKFKTNLILSPLQSHGIDTAIDDFISTGLHQRRRVDFWAKNWDGEIQMGFHKLGSQRLVNMKTCLTMRPALESLLSPLRKLMKNFLTAPKERVHIHVVEASNGIDMLLTGRKRPLNETETASLLHFARQYLCRLQVKEGKKFQCLYMKEIPYVLFAGHPVSVSPNSFLQATHSADKILSNCVIEGLLSAQKPPLKVVDLYCGRGTLTLPLIEAGFQVTGYEADKRSISALSQFTPHCFERDLYTAPLTAEDLNQWEAVIINPPRTGAFSQTMEIVNSRISTVAYVSCGPETFARDAAYLYEAGFCLKKLTAVDQFHYAAHVEVVGIFERNSFQ